MSIVIQPDSMLPTYLIRGGVGAIAIAGIAGFVAIVGNMKPPLPAEEPSQPIITPVQPAPESPVDQVQPSVFKPSTRQFDDPRPDGGREGLPIDPEGVQRKPYDAWKPGGPLPDGGRGPDARVGPRRGDRQPPSPPLR